MFRLPLYPLALHLIVGLLLLTGCENKTEITERSISLPEKPQTNEGRFVLHTIQGSDLIALKTDEGLRIEGMEGKVVLLDFFATWCAPCLVALPHLVDLQNRNESHLSLVGLLMEQGKGDEQIRQFAGKYKINYPIVNSSQSFLLGEALGGVKSMPTMILFDGNGRYYTHYLGVVPQEMIEKDILGALKATRTPAS